MNGTKPNRISRRLLWGALALACVLPAAAPGAVYTTTWKSGGASGSWASTDGGANMWYRFDDAWDIRREDLATGQWSSSGTKNPNAVVFANGDQATMTVNAEGGAEHQINQIWFSNSTSRTFAQDGGAYLKIMGDGTSKIEAASGSGTGTYTFSVPLLLAKAVQINPVGGNLTFNNAITNGGYWIDVYGANQKTLTIGGVLSGSGGVAVKQDSLVVITNNNTFTGGLWVEKGTVQLGNSTNALGVGAPVNVGTNATLDLNYGAVTLWPSAVNLYGTGTNANWGALRKTTASATTLRGCVVTIGADSRIVASAGNLHFYSNIVIGANTLYVTNANAMNMNGGEMTGSKTTGDGALRKSGAGNFLLRPGSGLTGSIFLDQGAILQDTGNSSVLPSGGILAMSNGVTYQPEGTTVRAVAKETRLDGDVTLGYSGYGRLTFSANMNLAAGQRTITTPSEVTISGAITNGGLTKAGAATLTLLGANTYALGTTISAGVLQIGSNGTAGSVSGNITNSSALAFYRSDATTFGGVISGAGALTNLAGTLTLSGANTLSGASRVAGGMVVVSGSLSSSAVTVDSGAALAGAGAVGALTVNGMVSPGNATNDSANLGCAALTLGSGGSYTFNIANAAGAPGTDWDKITGSGTLTVNGSGTFTIHVNGAATGFSSATGYSWPILSGTSVSGFDAARFAINTNNFSAPTAGGAFSVAQSTTNIVLVFTPSAPAAPTGLTASDGTSTANVSNNWGDVAGETGYVIWRYTADVPASATPIYTNAANTTNYLDTSAVAGQKYYYWVTATNASGSSAKSASDSGYRKLATVSITAATDGTDLTKVALTWTDITGETGYGIWRNTANDSGSATFLAGAAADATSADDSTATPGQQYYYWIRATNSTSAGQSDFQGSGEGGYRKLPTVTGVAATSNLTDKVTVTWTDSNNGETGYTVWRHTADASGSATLISGAALGANAVSYDDSTAVAGTPYWYWVRATNSTSASLSDFSASYGGQRTLSEPTTAASAITFSSVAPTTMTVGWTSGNGDSVLVVAKQGSAPSDPTDTATYTANAAFGSGDTTDGGLSRVVYKGTGTSVPVTGLSAGTEYYFAVYEFNGAGGQENYRTSDEPVSNKTTLATEPGTQATTITITGTNEVTLTGINWTDGNGASRLVVAKAGSAVDSFPVDATAYTAHATFGSGTQIGTGNYVVHAGSGPLATLSGLTRDVTYHFRVFEFNGSGVTANYLTNSASGNPASQTTMAGNPSSAASSLALSAIGSNQFTITWAKGTAGTNTLILVKTSGISTDPSDLTTYTADAAFGSGTQIDGASVVYTNTGTSVTVTGLTPGARYYVRAYAFNGAAGAQNYRTSDEPAIDGYTLMVEPSQATSVAFGTLGSTSYAVSYTAGGGLNRLVVAKAGSAVTFLPADGTAYTGENNNIGSATDLGSGNLLVHRGASPFTLSGLTAQTEYHLRVFEYQGTNTTLNYNTNAASGNPNNRYSLSTEPSAHAATFAATALSDTQIKLDWGAATGESGFVIVRKSGSAPTGTPADGTAYAQGNAIGDGTVVYVGTTAGAGSVTDSYSTAAATVYHYQIFPYTYNGTPAQATYNYRTSASIPGATATTGSSEPAASSTLTSFLPASSSSATVIWTHAGTADGSILLVKSNSAVSSNPSDWTNYTASTTFASGAQIGTGNYVVFTNAVKFGSVEVTNLVAGSTYHIAIYPYNGSGTLLNYRTTSPATGSLTMLPAPTAQSAAVDGKTMVRLAWTKNPSYDVMIVHRAGSASTDPTQGTAYSVGGSCGGGTVIYKGSAAALEHVVASGTTHYYAFYSYNGDYYSAGATASAATTAFAAGEIVETFSYTNNTSLSGLNGSNGWSGAWSVGAGSWTNQSGTDHLTFANMPNYPTNAGNRLKAQLTSATEWKTRRDFSAVSSGKIYVAGMVAVEYKGAGKYTGIRILSNGTEKAFFGETGGNNLFGIDGWGGGTQNSSFNINALEDSTNNTYLIVGRYDFSTRDFHVKAFYRTTSVPDTEPGSWDTSVTLASGRANSINGIELVTGGFSGGSPGRVYFDEVRVASSWGDLIGVAPTKPADPTSQTATADGSEMVRLGWTTNAAGNSVMILQKTTAISTDPTDGTGYSVGNTIGGATVIYKGAAAKLEHVVSPGTTNFYKFYSYNGSDYYSTGVVASATNNAYAEYERVNPFSYTNNTTLGTSTVGGQGFGANAWSVDSGTFTAQTNYSPAVVDSVPKFVNMNNYPAMAGNLVVASDPGNGGGAKAQRSLESAVNSGTFYIAFMMSYQYRGANKWAGVSLFNGGTEKAFFGKGAGGNWSTLGVGDGSTTYWSAFDMGEFYSGTGNTGNVYLVVGKYEFGTKLLAAKAYRILDGVSFPETEPAWDVSTTLGTGIDSIDRIKLNTGSTDGGATIGKVFFDEIRYATNWAGLIAVTCPLWAGSNTINGVAWTAASNSWLGDTENFRFQSYPTGLGQSGSVEFDWARTGAFASSYPMIWWQNANNNSYWTNQVQMTVAGVVTSRFAATGSSCSPARTNNPAVNVQNLNPPTVASATRDGVNTNSQINLAWTRGVSGTAKDTLIVRKAGSAPTGTPADGMTYNPGDALGDGTVVYRGAGTAFNDTGLAPSQTYYYRYYAENWTYYSTNYASASASTAAGGQNIAIDGSSADWVGSASAVLDSSVSSLQEFIWTDKRGELRVDNADHPNGDIQEFRVFADATWVYFLVKMTNITDATKPFVAIGVDTRTNSASTSMNWIGDDSGAFIGDGYFAGGAAHYPERQLNIHHVSADGGVRIEMYTHDGTAWYAPPTGGNTNVAISAANDVVELKVARADLNLSGATTGRFTVASYVNTGAWNNDSDGTVHITDNTADMIDAISIPPWSTPDNSANLSAWLEDISDADVDFWVDVKFAAAGLSDNSKPATPALVSPTNTAATTASPTLSWQPSSDSDGQITGYLLEISTNDQFNGVSGAENGTVDLRVNLVAATTNYTYTTSATQYWWRVRARDTAGELSTATTRVFRVVGKLDTEGPQPTLLYIGTNVAGYLAGAYDAHIAQYGPIQSVLDSELQNTNNVFGFVLRWEDASGVYATNKMRVTDSPPVPGGFAFNIVSTDGRVSPNWDIVEYTEGVQTKDWAKDAVFYASNTLATGNSDAAMTNYVHAAFSMTNYNPSITYYLTVSAEDAYSDGSWWSYGSWPSFTNSGAAMPYYSGWCEDGPSYARNITTNLLIEINVVDDDIVAPRSSTNRGWANEASLVVSNAVGPLAYVSGTGQDVLYQVTDGALIGNPLYFNFNAYDSYYQGVAAGTGTTFSASGRTLTNSAFVAAYWQTNWANYSPALSLTSDTRNANTVLAWLWPSITTQDVTKLWGPDGLAGDIGVTNLIQLDLLDVDNDRDGDQANARVNFGRIRLVDDDATNPVIDAGSLSVLGTGLAREYALTNLVEWTFPSGSSSLTSTNVAAGVTSSPISHGPSGALQGASNLYMEAQFYKPATNRYLLFSLTPATTAKTFKVSSISFESRVQNANGPDLVELWGTMPGGSETLWASNLIDLADTENPVGTNWNSYSTVVAMPASSTGTVQFKLLARVADTNHLISNDNANWYVDNLIVSGYILGEAGGAQITDRDLAKGTVSVGLQAYDNYSGLDATIGATTGRAPRVDFWNVSSNVCPVTNAFVTNGLAGGSGATTGTTLIAISGQTPAATDRRQIALGAGGGTLQYYARFTVNDYDVDRDGDSRALSLTTTNTVYDNDSSKPARGYLFGGPLGVYVDGALTKAVSSGNSREYRINDEQLQAVSATSITVKVNLYDFSGWTVPTLVFSNATAGAISTNGWLTALHTTDVDTTNKPEAAMEWRFDSSQAATLFNSYESLPNEFNLASVWDKDDDRLDTLSNNVDNLELAGARVGYVTFIDNDVGQPYIQTNWSVSRSSWAGPKVYLGLPGDAARSNLYVSGLPADTNSGIVLSDLTNRVYDSQLAKVSAAAPLSVVLPIVDYGGGGGGRTVKGVRRGTTLTESSTNGTVHTVTNTWISLGTGWVQNASAFNTNLSSSLALTKIAAQFPTSTWAFTSFSYAEVGTWLPAAAAASNHVLSAAFYDADDNRAGDQRFRESPLGTLRVLDNDTVAPVAPTNLTVNGVVSTGGFDRAAAPWTNQPDFLLRFKPGADGAPAGTDLEMTGIGEYRTATAKAGIGPDLGTPLAVPTEGALANYGFEHGSNHWTLSGAVATNEQAYEGTNSLKMLGSTGQQTVFLFNTNAYAPRVTVLGAQYRGTGTVAVSIAGLNANGDPVGGAAFDVSIVGVAGQWVGAAAASNTLATTVDRVRVTLTSGANTYWDDIRVKIELLNAGVPVDEVAAEFTAVEQGLTTNYLFAVDRDNNRPGDRKASSAETDTYIPAFGTAYDITPPTAVGLPANAASTENVGDPTSQFDIQWITTGVGPDDEGSPVYPSARFSGNDVLSPWRSYKIYYGTFNPLLVPGGDPGHGNGSAYIYTNFIATGAYSNWPSVSATNAIADPSGAGTNYLALTNLGQSVIRLYDLDYDQDYAVIVVGVDKAGNEGPASPSSWATNNTIKFAVTQGMMKARAAVLSAFPTNNNLQPDDKGAGALYWIAAGPTNAQGGYSQVNKDYDLIYWDAASFDESSNILWSKVGTVRSNWFTDAESQNFERGEVRFYRASYKDRWQRTNVLSGLPQRPLASEEVYALHNVVLSEGYNYVGLHGEPFTNTFLGVFGADTNLWPAGSSPAAGATKVEFYSAGTNAPVSAIYFFGTDAHWYLASPLTQVTTNLQTSNFFTRGFSITLPTNLLDRGYATTTAWTDNFMTNSVDAMVWHPVLKVPTNGPGGGSFTHEIATGVRNGRVSTLVYNVVSLNLPVSVHPSQMRFPTNFFRGDASIADQIYTLNTSTKSVLSGHTIYCDTGGTWRFVPGAGNPAPGKEVPPGYFKPNDVIVIVSRNGGLGNHWNWTYHPTNFYALPTRWMGQ